MKNALFLVALVTIIACSDQNKNIKIGVVAPLTGEGATYGRAMKNGFDLAFENTDFQLIYEDSRLSAKDGLNAFNKLINVDRVEVVYGAAASSVTLAMAPMAEKNKKIVFSSISTADEISNSGEFIFRNVPSNLIQGNTAADFLIDDLEIREIAVLKENDDYGVSISNSFIAQIQKRNGEILAEESYVATDTDFRTQLLKIKSAQAKALFIPGNYEESALIIRQAREMGFEAPIIGGDGSYSNELIKVAGNSSENFYCTHFGINEQLDFYKGFVSAFRKKHNREPDVYEAYAYEAGLIIKDAIVKVGNDAKLIKDFLNNNEFNSLTGKIKFDDNGDVKRSFGVLIVRNGKFENLK